MSELVELIWSKIGFLVPLAGLGGILVGVALAIRISRPREHDRAEWRYKDRSAELSIPARLSSDDVRAARRMARLLLGVAIVLPFVALLAWIAQPAGFQPLFNASPWWAEALPWAGATAYAIGLGWMIRIYRADPEPGDPTGRYRD